MITATLIQFLGM